MCVFWEALGVPWAGGLAALLTAECEGVGGVGWTYDLRSKDTLSLNGDRGHRAQECLMCTFDV